MQEVIRLGVERAGAAGRRTSAFQLLLPIGLDLGERSERLHSCRVYLKVSGKMSAERSGGGSRRDCFDELVRALGEEMALVMVKTFGGKRIRIPATTASPIYQEIEQAIGEQGFRLLFKAFGRSTAYIPKICWVEREKRNETIRQRFDELTTKSPGDREPLTGRKALACLASEFGRACGYAGRAGCTCPFAGYC